MITLRVDDSIADKFRWLIGQFSPDEVKIVKNDFDYISTDKLDELKKLSDAYKDGVRDDFEEYVVR